MPTAIETTIVRVWITVAPPGTSMPNDTEQRLEAVGHADAAEQAERRRDRVRPPRPR